MNQPTPPLNKAHQLILQALATHGYATTDHILWLVPAGHGIQTDTAPAMMEELYKHGYVRQDIVSHPKRPSVCAWRLDRAGYRHLSQPARQINNPWRELYATEVHANIHRHLGPYLHLNLTNITTRHQSKAVNPRTPDLDITLTNTLNDVTQHTLIHLIMADNNPDLATDLIHHYTSTTRPPEAKVILGIEQHTQSLAIEALLEGTPAARDHITIEYIHHIAQLFTPPHRKETHRL